MSRAPRAFRRSTAWLALAAVACLLILTPAARAGSPPGPEAPRATRPELLLQDGHSSFVMGLSVSRDGTTLASHAIDGAVKLWDTHSGKVLSTLPVGIGLTASSLAGDGRMVATGNNEGLVGLWDPRTSRALASVPVGKETIVGLAFSPDGSRLAIAHGGKLSCYDVASRRALASVPLEGQGTASLAWSPDGRLVAACKLRRALLWSPAGGASPRRFEVGDGSGVHFTADGRRVQVGEKVWDVASGRPVAHVALDSTPRGCALSPDGSTLYVIVDHRVLACDLASGKRRTLLERVIIPTAFEMSADGRTLYLGLTQPIGQIRVVDTTGTAAPRTLAGRSARICTAIFSRDARTVFTRTLEGALVSWDLDAGRPRIMLPAPPDQIFMPPLATHAGPDGTVAAALPDRVLLWNARGEKLPVAIDARNVRALALGRDGRRLVTGEAGGRISSWELPSGRLEREISREQGPVLGLAMRPDGQRVAFCQGGAVREWSFEKQAIVEARVFGDMPAGLDYSPDGRRLAFITRRGQAWLLSPGQWQASKPFFTTPDQAMFAVRFSPDGSTLAVGANRNTFLLDVATGKPRVILPPSQAGYHSLAFSPDGTQVVTTGWSHGPALFWEAATGRALCTLVEIDGATEWVVTAPDGLFDGSPAGQKLLEWRIGDRTYALDQFYNDFFTPGLLQRILRPRARGETTRPAAPVDITRLHPPPSVAIVSPRPGTVLKESRTQVEIRVTDQGGGISGVRLYRNGHRVPAGRAALRGGTMTFNVDLVDGPNELRASAFDDSGKVESRPDRIALQCRAPRSTTGPRLYLLAAGVDRYRAGMKLSFAARDARAMAAFFKPGLFADVRATCLVDQSATRQALLDALTAIEKEATPQDVLVVYLAGHGVLLGDLFYFLPHDVRVDTDDDIRATAVSTVDLGEALTRISASKQVLVLDACHSGASAPAVGMLLRRRDSIGLIRAQQRLARTAGSFLIAASTAEQYAQELPELGHGVLTYAILSGLGDRGQPEAPPNDQGQVTVNSLLRYLSDEVPRLTEKFHGDRQEIVQASTGQDFPLVVTPARKPAPVAPAPR